VFDRFPHAVLSVDDELRVVSANAQAGRLLGPTAPRSGEALTGELRAFAERLISQPGAPPSTSVLELPSGRDLRVAGVPATDDELALLLIEDVTEEHRHDRVMREFVRNAAHQLRTPLTGIAAAVQVLQSGAKENPEERDRFLQHIERHTARLARIAHSLLILARAQSGEEPRLRSIALARLLEQLARDAEPSPGVTLEVSCPSSLAALGEHDLLREALAALVDNAVSHTTEGVVELSATESGGDVSIVVSDSGSGISPEHGSRLFEPFYRADSTGDGFGLGLAIAAQAVGAMKGELSLDAAPRGARFTIRLPSTQIVG
jgi:signal transduction histidine kinase